MSRTITLFFILLTFQWTFSSEQQRGLWVVRYALSEEHEIQKIIDTAKQLNITDIYIQVRALGNRFYGSATELQKRQDENLRRLSDLAQDRNIRLHAWINMMYIWSGNTLPGNTGHVLNQSRKAVLRTFSDTDIPVYGDIKKQRIEGYFVHPTDPYNILDVREIIYDVLVNYGMHGIHLDYFRMPSLDYSFSPYGRTRFMQKYFIDPVKIYSDPEEFAGQRGNACFYYADQAYKDFLRDEFSETLRELKDYIRNISEQTVLTVAVKPDPINAKHHYFQDWQGWLSTGLCDQVLMMNYTPVYEDFKQNILLASHSGQNDRIIVGIATYNQDALEARKRILLIRNLDFAGIALFSYNYLSENETYLKRLSLIMDMGGMDDTNNPRSKGD